MRHGETLQSMLSLLIFGFILLALGAMLGVSGWLPLAIVCLVLGGFFCAAGLGVRAPRK